MFTKDPLLKRNRPAHSPHNIIPKLIKDNTVVLDVGCNTGFLAETLKVKNILTDGIDINDQALKKAKKYCRKIFKRNLYYEKLNLDKRKYDYIVFSDILEHLPRPDSVLIDAKKYLKQNGLIIASIPNIARLELRLKLLFGKFDYEPSGIMSKDHLRFFTKDSATRMFNESGYEIIQYIPTGLGYMIKVLPKLTGFQFIYVCRKK